ncbi:MAG: acylphosphatase [Microgenomates group bacterium Gr01-1014_7]|nr:MAG: acylphosphatase [Microgenomates group bacterium Gr01-1014_7]
MKKHFNIKIYGQVQGVFFRASAREKAESLGITGFVQNQPDGSVYIEAEGEDDMLNQFLSWCHEGPPAADVEEIKAAEGPMKKFSHFST